VKFNESVVHIPLGDDTPTAVAYAALNAWGDCDGAAAGLVRNSRMLIGLVGEPAAYGAALLVEGWAYDLSRKERYAKLQSAKRFFRKSTEPASNRGLVKARARSSH
jgi:hypothetical protein